MISSPVNENETVKKVKNSNPVTEKETVKVVWVENEQKPIQTNERVDMQKKPESREKVLNDIKQLIDKHGFTIPYKPGTPEYRKWVREGILAPLKKIPKIRKTIYTEEAMRGYVARGRVSQERYDKWDAARKEPITDYLAVGPEKRKKFRSELEKEREEVSNYVQGNQEGMDKRNEKRETRKKEEGEDTDSEEAKQMKQDVEKLKAEYKEMRLKREGRSNRNDEEKTWVFLKYPSVIEKRKRREKNEKK
jgi:hypothetical protein